MSTSTHIPDALTQAAALLKTPDALRQWLAEQDPKRRIDPGSPCGCFIHWFLWDTQKIRFSVHYDLIELFSYNGEFPQVTVSQRWFKAFQEAADESVSLTISEAGWEEEETIDCATALRILDAVIAQEGEA
jgi:hypothetical protein